MIFRSARLAIAVALAGLTGSVARAASPNDLLPDDPAKAVLVRACTSCHQAPQIVAKRHTEAEWDALVGKMIDRGARASDDEQDQIITYLTKYFGPTPAKAPAPAK
jgi:hypothetical protein